MASTPLWYDRVLETSTTTGTGTLTLAGAVTGYQTFAAVGNGNSCEYYLEGVDANGIPTGEWERGVGTYTTSGTTLSRTYILSASTFVNATTPVTLSAGTKRVALSRGASLAVPVISDFGGRLTLESGVSVSTTDQLAKGHLFYTPHLHNRTPKWNGSSWERVTFAEYDLTLSLTSGKNYDVWWDGSALSLSAAWTNNTTRADALSTQDAVPCLGSDKTKLHVGTIYATTTNQTADSGGFTGTTQVGGMRGVWNRYNQVRRSMHVIDTTATWSYATDTIRQSNGATAPLNGCRYVTGDAALLVEATVLGTAVMTNTVGTAAKVGIGIDSSSAFSGRNSQSNGTGDQVTLVGSYDGYPGLGLHTVNWLERGDASGSIFVGSVAGSVVSGLVVYLAN